VSDFEITIEDLSDQELEEPTTSISTSNRPRAISSTLAIVSRTPSPSPPVSTSTVASSIPITATSSSKPARKTSNSSKPSASKPVVESSQIRRKTPTAVKYKTASRDIAWVQQNSEYVLLVSS